MQKLKVMTLLGTRPEIIRLSEIMRACDRHFEHILVHTGQNWDYRLNRLFFEELALREPDFALDCAGETPAQTIGSIIAKSDEVMRKAKPDALLILGDTNSALAAIAAKRLKIPVFHMEAGNRCFDENVPEEINRRIVDHISDVNLPYTEHSRRYLLAEGLPGKYIFVTGSPMREVLKKNAEKIGQSQVLEQLGLKPGGYLIVSAHREENVDSPEDFAALTAAIAGLAEEYGLPVLYSVHPRSRKQIEKLGITFPPQVKCMQPFGFFDYNKLQQNAFCVLSDSGTLSEESAMLGFPGVLLRTSTERPEALDKGSVVIGGIGSRSIAQAVELARATAEDGDSASVSDYEDDNVSAKVVKLIQSYTPIINRNVWGKRD